MAFHTFNETGQNHSRQEVETKITQAQEDDRWSFVEREILEQLLASSNCVGIRVYNTFNDESHNRLIVVGVTEDGAEIQKTLDGESGYLTSRIKIADSGEIAILKSNNILRDTALVQVRVRRAQPDLDFASFFSAETIRQLLKPEDCNGVNFYWIKIQQTEQISFPSHLAASAQFSDDSKQITLPEDGVYISCPLPCPPHCAPEATTSNAGDNAAVEFDATVNARSQNRAREVDIDENSFDRYLLSWM